MSQHQPQEITRILKAWSSGRPEAVDDLMPLVYEALRKVAAQYLRRQRPDHTLQPTALVNEAYLKLIDISEVDWNDRAHFFAVASQTMRHILVDHARSQARKKRGGSLQKLSLDEAISFSKEREVDLLSLDEALQELAKLDEQQAKIIELRFFGGLTIDETAHVVGISPATVKREWVMAKSWLFRKLKQ